MKKCIILSVIVAGMLIGCGGGSSNKQEKEVQKPNKEVTKPAKPTQEVFKFSKDWFEKEAKSAYWVIAKEKMLFKVDFKNGELVTQNGSVAYDITDEGYLTFKEEEGEHSGEDVYIKAFNGKDKLSLVFSYDKEELANKNDVSQYFFRYKAQAQKFVQSL